MISNPAQCCQRGVLQHFPEFRDTKSVTFHHKMSQEKSTTAINVFFKALSPNYVIFFQLSNRPKQCVFFLQFVVMASLFFVVLITVGYPQSVGVSTCLARNVLCRVSTCRAEFLLSSQSLFPAAIVPNTTKQPTKKKTAKKTANLGAVVERRRAKKTSPVSVFITDVQHLSDVWSQLISASSIQ